METSGSITNFNNIEKAERNEKLHHFFAEAKPKTNEKRAKSMVDEHVQVYHNNTLKNIRAALNRHIKDLNRILISFTSPISVQAKSFMTRP